MNTFHLASLALLVGLISAGPTSTYPHVDAVIPEIESVDEDKRPVLLITVGPTGSGKTALAEAAAKEIAPNAQLEFSSFLIDDDVEKDPVYTERVKAILDEVGVEAVRDPSAEILSRFEKAYFDTRRWDGCAQAREDMTREIVGDPTPTSPHIFQVGGGCDIAFDLRLSTAITKDENILFETTGLYYPKWLVEATGGRYRVVIAYTTVTYDKLLERNKSRAYDGAVKFMKDLMKDPDHVVAPRLADLGDAFKSKISTIETGLKELESHKCWDSGTMNEEYCGKVPINELLVYDNNEKEIKLVDTYMYEK